VPALLARYGVASVSMALIEDGRVVLERAYGEQSAGVPATVGTLYGLASVTKPVSAETLLRLAAAGRLSLDEPVASAWVDPDVAGDPRAQVLTVRHALAQRDSVLHAAALDTTAAGQARVDSLRRAYAHADTVGRAAQMAAIQRSLPVATGAAIAPGGGTAPNLAAGAEGAVTSPSSLAVGASAPATAAALPAAVAVGAPGAPGSGHHATYGPPFVDPAHATADSSLRAATAPADSAHHAAARGAAIGAVGVTDGGSGVPGGGAAAPGAAAGASTHSTTSHAPAGHSTSPASQAAPAAPLAPKPPPGPISSLWVTQTKAERDSIKHAKVVADSTKKAEKAAKKAEHEAEQKAKHAAADSAKAGQH